MVEHITSMCDLLVIDVPHNSTTGASYENYASTQLGEQLTSRQHRHN